MQPFGRHLYDAGCFVHTSPFSAPRNVMLTMLVCVTRWLSMHLYMLAYMFMHEFCLLMCRPYFSTMKSWTSDPNLHLSPRRHHLLFAFFLICLLLDSLFVCLQVRLLILLLVMSPATCYCFACMLVCFIPIAHYLGISFFPLLICWFLVFAFACTHMERGQIELGHGLLGTSKKGADASM